MIVCTKHDTYLEFSIPSSVKPGDLLLCIIGCSDGRQCTTSPAWTVESVSRNVGKCKLYTFSFIHDGLTSTHRFDFDGRYNYGNGIIYVVKNTNKPIIQTSFGNNQSVTFTATKGSTNLYCVSGVYATTATTKNKELKPEYIEKVDSSYLLGVFSENSKDGGERIIDLNSIYWTSIQIIFNNQIDINTPLRQFSDLCIHNNACNEAIEWMSTRLDKPMDEAISEFCIDDKAQQGWSVWVLQILGKQLSSEVRKGFMGKIKIPMMAFKLSKNITLDAEEDALLQSKYSSLKKVKK